MAKSPVPCRPRQTDKARRRIEERRRRLAAALRDNLKKRKEQARARSAPGPEGGSAEPSDPVV